MSFEVWVTLRAQQDLEAARRFVAKHAPETVDRWFHEILEALLALESNPAGRPLAAENDAFAFDLREFICRTKSGKPNRALFCVVGKQVRVLAIRRPGQQLATPDDLKPSG